MTLNTILDIVVIVLLIPTLVFAAMLNNRLTVLRKNKDQLGRLINSFNEATMRAESTVPKLRKAADEAGQALHEHVERAHTLRDDLAFMVERADSMASRLESTVRTARNEPKAPSAPAPNRMSAPLHAPRRTVASAAASLGSGDSGVGGDDERSEAERDLLRALQSAR
ncbi:MAG: hypothetical protein HQL37_02015 [Alphaproteobacteria bacterium]|nr:hypothetical protein [Alphaproteobacteria bacterium]